MLTAEAKRRMLEALQDAILEAGWGTSGAEGASALTDPRYTTSLYKAVQGETLVVEYVIHLTAGSYTVREVGLFGRDANGNRVLLWRTTRDPVTLTPPVVVRDRVELSLG